jgi:DNA-nicking Smr family endonuclease
MTVDKRDSRHPATPLADDDIALFRRSVADARPLDDTRVEPESPQVSRRARFSRRDEEAVLEESLAADYDSMETSSGDSLRFSRPGVGRKTMRKLSRGNFSVQSEIDLHGMTIAAARPALKEFIEHAVGAGQTCVRVIHGKGLGSGPSGPVIKHNVNGWLRQWDQVLAFVSARPIDGGTGALYVLLKIR